MKQEKHVISRTQEYPGTVTWTDFSVRCPICKQMVANYGEIEELDDDGDWHQVCVECGRKELSEIIKNQEPI